ncbi:MAG: Rieske 2Fe-2S domain-containing protein [Chloroflexota bacterium]|nr:Rieske 2Fe-2S domain-containing protein [Chloroflexota bacterium]
MQIADKRANRDTLTPRTGVEGVNRPEDTAGGIVAPKSRRDFLKWGLFGSLLLMLGGFGQAFLAYFYPKKVGAFGGKIALTGALSDYPLNSVTPVREGKFYLSHTPDGLLALYWKCKHLGCTVPWKPDEEFQGNSGVFHCPCHGSVYLRTGQNVAGPAPAPLDLMAIDLSGGKITVNTGKITTRVRAQPSDAVKV